MPRDERREQVLDAALRVLVRDGWGALRIDPVAAEAEIAKSVLYAVFGSRDGLVEALLAREQGRALATAQAALAAAGDADTVAAGVDAALRTFLARVEQEPDTWRLVLLPPDGTPADVRALSIEGRDRWWQAVEPVVARMLHDLGLGALDPQLVAHLARGNAEYLARLMLEQPAAFPRERLLRFGAEVAASVAALTASDGRRS